MKLPRDALARRSIVLDLKAQNLSAVFEQVVEELVKKELITPDVAGELAQKLQEREDVSCSAS